MKIRLVWRLMFVCVVTAMLGEGVRAAEGEIDFANQVRPILLKYCSECHGAKEQKSEFRVDLGSRLLEGGNSGAAIEPGKPEESLLLKSLMGAEDVVEMPPKDPKPTSAKPSSLNR